MGGVRDPYRPARVQAVSYVPTGTWHVMADPDQGLEDAERADTRTAERLLVVVHFDDERTARDVVALCAENDVDVEWSLRRWRDRRDVDEMLARIERDLHPNGE